MASRENLTPCLCCGQDKPEWDFARGQCVCSVCRTLTPDEAVKMARSTMSAQLKFLTQTKDGRKAARVAAKVAQYEQHGKRCTACHNFKKPDDYNKCAPMADGLQPICRTCNQLRVISLRAGGPQQWHQVRDALRKASPEGK